MPFSTQADTVDDLMRRCIEEILRNGEPITPSRGGALEVVGVALELTNSRARLSRSETRRRVVSAIAELCWYLGGTNRAEPIVYYVGTRYEDEAEPDGTIHGGYGPRLFGVGNGEQIHRVIELLRANPSSRRAVVQLFDRSDIADAKHRYKDVPCTCTIQFLVRNDLLHLVVNMRSNDVHLGLPPDVFSFTMLQELVARSLDIEPGRYIHVAGSLHLYNEHRHQADEFLGEGWHSTTDPMPSMPMGDPWRHVGELLAVEEQIRSGLQYDQLELPSHAYWADLARILASWVARKKLQDEEAAARIDHDIVHSVFSEFNR